MLDEFLPRYDFNEVHSVAISASPTAAMEAVRNVTAPEVPVLVVLMAIRSLPGLLRRRLPSARGPLLDSFGRAGFVTLHDSPDELVLGAIGRFWQPSGGLREIAPAEFADFAEPGYAKGAVNFRVERDGQRTRVTTETRVAATDEGARRRFARYWRVVYPGSALIRRDWLRAIRRRAERSR